MAEETTGNQYSMDTILGEGGSGTVYLGVDEAGEKVVIKQFKGSILDFAPRAGNERSKSSSRSIIRKSLSIWTILRSW